MLEMLTGFLAMILGSIAVYCEVRKAECKSDLPYGLLIPAAVIAVGLLHVLAPLR